MKNHLLRTSCLVLTLTILAALKARGESEALQCGKGHAWLAAAAADSADFLKYAPSRQIQILHLTLDVTPNFKARTVTGSATLRFKPIAQPLSELKLDGVDLSVSSVLSSEPLLGWQATERNVIVTFAEPIPAG